MEFVSIPLGVFQMGSPNEVYGEGPPHEVRFGHGFALGRYPVTQRQWIAIMGSNPSTFDGSPDYPVDSVSWEDAVGFCARLSRQAGRRVRLPSEAEWEYACRSGTSSDFFFTPDGPFLDETEVSSRVRTLLCDYAWFDWNSGSRPHPVGRKRPNPWGLHDMVGSVWEWCADAWHPDYTGAPRDGSAWLEGHLDQPRRCVRGGAWDMDAFRCRSAYRSFEHCTVGASSIGLRVVVEV